MCTNHLEGHALSPGLENKIDFPYLLLLISGGHSQYLNVQGLMNTNNWAQQLTMLWVRLLTKQQKC